MATQSHPAFFLLPPILPAILFILVDFSSFSFLEKLGAYKQAIIDGKRNDSLKRR